MRVLVAFWPAGRPAPPASAADYMVFQSYTAAVSRRPGGDRRTSDSRAGAASMSARVNFNANLRAFPEPEACCFGLSLRVLAARRPRVCLREGWAAAEVVSEPLSRLFCCCIREASTRSRPSSAPAELEQVIQLVSRSPRVYPPGTLDALKHRRALVSPEPPKRSGESTRMTWRRKSSTLGRPALIRGASRRPAHQRDPTPALIGGASSTGLALRTLSGAKLIRESGTVT